MDKRKASLLVVMLSSALTAVAFFAIAFIGVFLGPESTLTNIITSPTGAGVALMMFGMLSVMGLGLVHIIINP